MTISPMIESAASVQATAVGKGAMPCAQFHAAPKLRLQACASLMLLMALVQVAGAQEFPSPEELAAQQQNLPELYQPVVKEPISSAAEPKRAPVRGNSSATPLSEDVDAQSFHMLGSTIAPGSAVKLKWEFEEGFIGQSQHAAVLVRHGVKPGPVLCMTGAIHGDELNGIEVVRRVINGTDPTELSGTLIGVPIVNVSGFARGSRYLPDRRDLNRFFPGSPKGSSASRIAYSFYNNVIDRCTHLVDFHTGSFERSNLPQVRGDLRIPSVQEFTRGFGATTVLHSPGAQGMLRRAATSRGIAAVTFEIGAPIRLEPEEIGHGYRAMETLLNRMGMVSKVRVWKETQPFFYESRWVRTGAGGMLFTDVDLGDQVKAGQVLGRVIDPIGSTEHELIAPFAGRILGLALNQMVMPGFAIYHIGGKTTEAQAVRGARKSVESEIMEEGEDGPASTVNERRDEPSGKGTE
jgi:hypothetical protein